MPAHSSFVITRPLDPLFLKKPQTIINDCWNITHIFYLTHTILIVHCRKILPNGRRRTVFWVFRDIKKYISSGFNGQYRLKNKYTVDRSVVLYLCHTLLKKLKRPKRNSYSLPVLLQVMAAVHYILTTCFQQSLIY